MQFHRTLDHVYLADSWLTIGSFDGVHVGHQAILKKMVSGAHAAGLPAVVLTFDPHPMSVLRPEMPLQLLTTIEERAELFERLGVDHVVAHPFNHEIAQLAADVFIARLKNYLGFSTLLVGYDFAMGHNREGNVPALRRYGDGFGYELIVFEPVGDGPDVASSSRIRRAVADGDVETAQRLLGRPYSLSGRVVSGSRRGRSIGIPTANISVRRGLAVPRTGVYACRVTVHGKTYGAATNIGVRPTFEPDTAEETVEAHLLDFDQDIYHETVQVSFFERLRGEQKFESVDPLVSQIRADIARAREVLNETVP